MKPRILLAINVYLPGYLSGGPIRSIAGLVELLGDEFEIFVVTSDRDSGAPSPYTNVQLDGWNRVGKAQVHYMRRSSQTVTGMARLLRETPCDLLYLNSFFSPRFSIIPLMVMRLGLAPKRPVLLAPRGEFSSAAYGLKRWRKRLFVGVSRILSLHRGVRWSASSDFEAEDIRRVLCVPSTRISVARDLVAPEEAVERFPRNSRPSEGPLRVCFLSRISRMKNLDYALRVLAQVTTPVIFNIYGPREDPAYWHECECLVTAMPNHVEVRYEGAVRNEQVCELIARHDVFFLPTRGENFGHVVLEALSAGVPVLISDQTPWKQLEEQGVGWDLSLADERQHVGALESLAALSSIQREHLSARCRDFAERHIYDHIAITANRRMVLDALDVGGKGVDLMRGDLNEAEGGESSGVPRGVLFHEEIALEWTSRYSRDGFSQRLDLFRQILRRQVSPGDLWADMGCGSGVLCRELLALGATVVAVDGSPSMLSHAREQMGSQYAGRVDWIESDVQSVDALRNETFSGVLCSSVVEYLDRPDTLLKEVARILSPGGILILSMPPTFSAVRMLQKWIRAFMRLLGKDKFKYLSVSKLEISPRALNRLFQEAGFSLIRSTKFDPVLPRALLRVVRPSLLVMEARKLGLP